MRKHTWIRKITLKILNYFIELHQEQITERLQSVCVCDSKSLCLDSVKIDNSSGEKERIRIGKNTYIRGTLFVAPHQGKIEIGEWSYVGENSKLLSMSSITIGDRVLVSHNVTIADSTSHSLDASERFEQTKRIFTKGHPRNKEELPGIKYGDVVIEDDVWINPGVIILKGVRIGARSVISAGAIVCSDVPPDSIFMNETVPKLKSLVDNV